MVRWHDSGVCRNGLHDVTGPGSRTKYGRCRECFNARHRTRNRTPERQAYMRGYVSTVSGSFATEMAQIRRHRSRAMTQLEGLLNG